MCGLHILPNLPETGDHIAHLSFSIIFANAFVTNANEFYNDHQMLWHDTIGISDFSPTSSLHHDGHNDHLEIPIVINDNTFQDIMSYDTPLPDHASLHDLKDNEE